MDCSEWIIEVFECMNWDLCGWLQCQFLDVSNSWMFLHGTTLVGFCRPPHEILINQRMNCFEVMVVYLLKVSSGGDSEVLVDLRIDCNN